MGKDFLLENEIAGILFHEYASELPIIDYHCHLPPDEIAQDKHFENVTRVWLNGDHYKWRAMRTLGVAEKYITGDASDRDKFRKWAATVPYTIRNPLYHWTHLELRRYFDIHDILKSENADVVYDACGEILTSGGLGVHRMISLMRVEVICTTDDPIDNLTHHKVHNAQNSEVALLPGFRPDKVLAADKEGYLDYIRSLSEASGMEIRSLDDLLQALQDRIDFFTEMGCGLADHGLERIWLADPDPIEANEAFKRTLQGQMLDTDELNVFRITVLHALCRMYHAAGWVQQFHLGALRNNNARMLRQLGPDTGFDSIGDFPQARGLAAFLDKLDAEDRLAKTIIYNLNPADNALMASMIGNFNDGSVRGKIQFGSAWWFLDQKDGIEKQLNALSNMGLLSVFIGMLTDSRSFLSFPRHEYFRRVLCNLIGRDVMHGELPNDIRWLGSIVQDICYRNAKAYFEFDHNP